MNRKEIARQTIEIVNQGYYEYEGERVDISAAHTYSCEKSALILDESWADYELPVTGKYQTELTVANTSTVEAILTCTKQGLRKLGVLNFASAKNPSGGFINGALAQEESLAASSGLYFSQIIHPEYYRRNRTCGTMCYTDCAIYSPDVVFFRNGAFELLPQFVTASVLTMPAVNFGQVLLKGEDAGEAWQVMRRRMYLTLLGFAAKGDINLILGAYGCGVFRNDPNAVAAEWENLLNTTFKGVFNTVVFAVLDSSKRKESIRAFETRFGV